MRLSASVLFVTAALVSGCSREPANSAEPVAAVNVAVANETPGPVVTADKLYTIELPAPKGLPEKGIWSSAKATVDGDRMDNFVDGADFWMTMRLLDCNLPRVQEAKNKSVEERGPYSYCFDTSTDKLKGYPLYKKNDYTRAIKVGHLMVIAGIGAKGQQGTVKAADLEAYLETLDLDAISKF